jgi:hypothetical protein
VSAGVFSFLRVFAYAVVTYGPKIGATSGRLLEGKHLLRETGSKVHQACMGGDKAQNVVILRESGPLSCFYSRLF